MEERLHSFLRIGLVKGYCIQNKTITITYVFGIQRKVAA